MINANEKMGSRYFGIANIAMNTRLADVLTEKTRTQDRSFNILSKLAQNQFHFSNPKRNTQYIKIRHRNFKCRNNFRPQGNVPRDKFQKLNERRITGKRQKSGTKNNKHKTNGNK